PGRGAALVLLPPAQAEPEDQDLRHALDRGRGLLADEHGADPGLLARPALVGGARAPPHGRAAAAVRLPDVAVRRAPPRRRDHGAAAHGAGGAGGPARGAGLRHAAAVLA